MYKNLHFKIILILAIFTITLMSVIGAVLIGSAFNFYSNDFMTQMEQAFEVGRQADVVEAPAKKESVMEKLAQAAEKTAPASPSPKRKEPER